MANFKVAISLANTGKIKRAYKMIDKMEEELTEEEIEKIITPQIELLKKDKNNILLLNYAAFCSIIIDDYEKAVDYFGHIEKLEPDNVWIQNFLAASYNKLEEYDKAEEILKKALTIQDNQYSHLLLGVNYYKKGHIFKAMGELSHSGKLLNDLMGEL